MQYLIAIFAIMLVTAISLPGSLYADNPDQNQPALPQLPTVVTSNSTLLIPVDPPFEQLKPDMQVVVKRIHAQCSTAERMDSRVVIFRIPNEGKPDNPVYIRFTGISAGHRGYRQIECMQGTIETIWLRLDTDYQFLADSRGYHQLVRTVPSKDNRIVVLDNLKLEPVTANTKATLKGTIKLEGNADLSGIKVKAGKTYETTTNSAGQYSFNNIGAGEIYLSAYKKGYTLARSQVNLKRGETKRCDLQTYLKRSAQVRWSFQPNGSRRFSGKDLREGKAILQAGGLDQVSFKNGFVQVQEKRDFLLFQKKDQIFLRLFDTGKNHAEFMKIKATAYDELLLAPERGYETRQLTVYEGDVYVFKCQGNAGYAKLEVSAILTGERNSVDALNTLTATRCNLPLLNENYQRPVLAFIDLDKDKDVSEGEAKALTDLACDWFRRIDRYTILDRESMIHILGEEDFIRATGCYQTGPIVRFGTKLQAQKIIHGRVSKSQQTMVLTMKMFDVDSRKLEAQETIHVKGGIDELFDKLEDLSCSLLLKTLENSSSER